MRARLSAKPVESEREIEPGLWRLQTPFCFEIERFEACQRGQFLFNLYSTGPSGDLGALMQSFKLCDFGRTSGVCDPLHIDLFEVIRARARHI